MSTMRKPVVKVLQDALKNDLGQAQITVERLVYSMPEVPFNWRGQFVDEAGNRIDADIEFYFVVNPRLIREEHNSEIQAIRDQIATAMKIYERIGSNDSSKTITRADLPSIPLLMELYSQLDDAFNRRLEAVVARDQAGNTQWNWTDENGAAVNMTAALLSSNAKLADLVHTAFNNWWNPTKPLSGGTILTKPDDTTQAQTPLTGAPSSAGSPTGSGADEKSNPTTGTEDTFPPGSEPSS